MLPDIQDLMLDAAEETAAYDELRGATRATNLVALVNRYLAVPELIVGSMEEAQFSLALLKKLYPTSPVVNGLIAVPFTHTGTIGEAIGIDYTGGEIHPSMNMVQVLTINLPY